MAADKEKEVEIPIHYYPHDRQWPFHQDRYKVKYRGLFGGGGSGKTLCGVYEDLAWMIENPGTTGAVFEPNYPMVKRNLFPILVKLLGYPVEGNPLVEEFNKSDLYLQLRAPYKSRLWFVSLDDPMHAEGQTLDFGHIDESRIVGDYKTAKAVVKRRLRGTIQKEKIGLWETTTPPFGFSNELYAFYEDPAKKDPESKVYRMSIMDNAANLPKGYIDDMVRTHTGGLREIFVYGRFADVEAGTFGFDSTVHTASSAPAIREVRYGVDFGWTNPTAVVCVGLDGDGRAYVLDEVYQRQMRTQDLIAECMALMKKYGTGKFICDRSEPQTIDEMRRGGLKAVAYEVKRDDGIRQLGERFKRAGDGRPRLFVLPCCVNLISELQTYDVERKENDHAVDALRYALATGASIPEPAYY